MKVLVTGATGFLGRWLCQALVEKGYTTYALVRPSSDTRFLQSLSVKLHKGDVTDLPSFTKAARGVDVMFHLAGLVAYAEKFRSAMRKVNVQGTAHAVEICRLQNIRLIYMSSVVAVGASKTPQVLNEESSYNMKDFNFGYFNTKKQAEELVQNACQNEQLSAIILNPSNVYGAYDMKKASRKTHIWVAKGRFPFYTKGGLSVVDVESVIETTINAIKKGRIGERYILSGDNITIKELFTMIAECTGVSPPFICLNDKVLDMIGYLGNVLYYFLKKSFLDKDIRMGRFYHWFDNTKAKQELGFSPQPARKAIANSVNWWKENIHNL